MSFDRIRSDLRGMDEKLAGGGKVTASELFNMIRDLCEDVRTETGVPVEAFREGYDRRSREADLSRFMMIEGIPETLERLSALGGRHYLATHRDTGALRALEMKGMLRYFDGWVTSEDHFPNKPAPDMLLHLLDRFSIDPAQAVMIGDRPLDTASGRAAGMLSCLLDVEGRFPDDPCELRTARAIALAALLCPAPVEN